MLHVLYVGPPDVPGSALREAISDVSADGHLTHVETVDTAEQHLLGSVTFDCLVLDGSVLGDQARSVVERLRTSQPTVPVVVMAETEHASELASALDAEADCTVLDRSTADWPTPLLSALPASRAPSDTHGEQTLTGQLLRAVPTTRTVDDALAATASAICANTPLSSGSVWQPAENGAFERIDSVTTVDGHQHWRFGTAAAGSASQAESVPELVSEAGDPVWIPVNRSGRTLTAAGPAEPVGTPTNGADGEADAWVLGVPMGDNEELLAVLLFVADARHDRVGEHVASATDGLATVIRQTRRQQDLEQYETIMETVGDGVYVLDDDGRFIAVNDAYVDLTGYSRAELLGTAASDIVGTDRTEQADAIQSTLEDSGPVSTLRTTIPTADGETVPVEAWISLFPLGNGTNGRVGVVRDVRDRLRLEEELSEILERVSDGFFALDTDWRFTYVNEQAETLIQREADALRGNVVWEEFPTAVNSAFETQYREAMASGESTTFVEYFPPLETWFRVHAYPSETGLSVYFADVTDEKRRSRKLSALTESVQSFPEAREARSVAERTAQTATDALEIPHAVVALYDRESGQVQPTATSGHGAESLVETALGDGGVAWDAYVEGEARRLDDVDGASGSAVVVPVESHGVLVAATSDSETFSETDTNLLNILGAHAKSALDRADREQELRERTDALEAKNDSLKRANRLNSIIRQITRVLQKAGTREQVEADVCTELLDTDPYGIAWFSRYESSENGLVPTTSAGIELEHLDTVSLADNTSMAAEAASTHRVTVDEDIHDREPPYEPWERVALKRGCQACLAVPVRYREELYGVLTLCAGGGNDIDELEQTVLSELGETIGYAINALQRKKALVSERTVDLEFRTGPFEDPLFDLLLAESTDFELETLVQRRDGLVHVFFSVSSIDPEAMRDAADQSLTIESLSVIADRETGLLVECSLSPDSLFSSLLDRGAMVRSLAFEDGDVRLVLRIPQSSDVRRFIDRLDSHFESVELISRRERDKPIQSVREFQSEFEQRLTDRQRQVIETAYYSGFFEWPRENTGVEVAEMLDVSQPTINRHIRRGQREIFGMLFDNDD